MALGKRVDPLTGYHFYVEVDGITTASFRECSGLDSENEIIEQKEAGKKGETIIRKIPGKLKWSNITLKRGMTDNQDLWKWRRKVIDGKVDEARKNGSIVIYNQSDQEVSRFNFVNGWPSKLTGPSLNATSNEVAIEEIVIAHEGLKREK